ncbi:hypothetical protein EPN15_04475 [Patescibacteria group bacterium]|nr:MAG: hypothetical protein EPN15_04475 [Patescibacteria group bacterium]
MAEEDQKEKEKKEAKIYLFNGSIVRGEIISPEIHISKGLAKIIAVKTSDLNRVSKSTLGFSREKAIVKLDDGSVFVGKLLGNIEIKCTDNEVVKVRCKEIFAIKTKEEE